MPRDDKVSTQYAPRSFGAQHAFVPARDVLMRLHPAVKWHPVRVRAPAIS